MSDPRFSAWFRPTAEAFAAMPAGPAVVQVKVAGRLIRYPLGQSAMVWYGAGQDGVRTATGATEAVANRMDARNVLWRYLAAEQPEVDLARLLRRFKARFGALPAVPELAAGSPSPV